MSQTLVKTFVVNGQSIDVGSDWHYPLTDAGTPAKIIAHVKKQKQSDVLYCLGDLFDTPDGQDSTDAINQTVSGFAAFYDQVIFTPGNHDLRGRDEPWDSFRFPDNVISPRSVDPVAVTVGPNRLLVANLFYDLGFIDPSVIGASDETIRKFYAKSNDGRHFLGGDIARFRAMTEQAARALTPEIDILVTHALPHPSLVTFRIPEVTAESSRLESELGIPFICDPADDQKMAEEYKRRGAKGEVTPADVRAFWNNKSIVMGSNLIGHAGANFRDGLTLIHGHHHRIDLKPRRIAGKTVHVVTHQPNPWNPESNVVL